MRCLECNTDRIAMTETVCPACHAYLPTVLRHVLPAGTILYGTYRIDYALAQGGFGIVYRAVHTKLDRIVAIKEFYPKDYAMREGGGSITIPLDQQEHWGAAMQQFLYEGRLLASLSHRGITSVQELFYERSTAYLVTEMLQGHTLRQELDSQPNKKLSDKLARKIIRQVAMVLEFLHKNNVYHLDIKPENIFCASNNRVVLVDFGAAREGPTSNSLPQFDPSYAPPEILNGRDAGPESDLFELGVMAYELLTGFRPETTLARMYGSKLNLDVLEESWQGPIKQALEITREKRPSSVRAWWDTATQSSDLRHMPKETIDIFLTPEEAQEKLETALSTLHVRQHTLQQSVAEMQTKLTRQKFEREQRHSDELQKLQEAARKNTELRNSLIRQHTLEQNEAEMQIKLAQQDLEREQQRTSELQNKLNEVTKENKKLRNSLAEKNKRLSRLEAEAKTMRVQENIDSAEEELNWNEMEALLAASTIPINIKRGDVVEGVIVRIDQDEILVDIGLRHEGILSTKELPASGYGSFDELHLNDNVLVYVIQPETSEGHAVLSLKRANTERQWRIAEEQYKNGELLKARVIDYNKGGLVVDVAGIRGFVPVSQILNLKREEVAAGGENQKTAAKLQSMKDKELQLKIIEINRARNRLILSERLAVQEWRTRRHKELLDELRPGEVRRGVVSNLASFGAFVDLGGADGLVHISQLAWSRVNHPSEILHVGQEVEVQVLSVDKDKKKIALSIKRAEVDP
jgi:serine/threonine protein kinase/predicted RNA-binding protein with RPS1 domain